MNIEQTVLEISGVEITKTILVDLQKLQQYTGEPIASVYADNLLRTMRKLRDKLSLFCHFRQRIICNPCPDRILTV